MNEYYSSLIISTSLLILIIRSKLSKKNKFHKIKYPFCLRTIGDYTSQKKVNFFQRREYFNKVKITKNGLESYDGKISKNWHNTAKNDPKYRNTIDPNLDLTTRSISVQSINHYDIISAQIKGAKDVLFKQPISPKCGENILLPKELNRKTVCIGDIYKVKNSTAILKVTNPRRPCNRYNSIGDGTFKLAMKNALAGFFLSVIKEGEININSEIELISRPNPQWTIYRVHLLVFGESGVDKKPKFTGTKQELKELANLEDLGWFQWREYLYNLYQSTPV